MTRIVDIKICFTYGELKFLVRKTHFEAIKAIKVLRKF